MRLGSLSGLTEACGIQGGADSRRGATHAGSRRCGGRKGGSHGAPSEVGAFAGDPAGLPGTAACPSASLFLYPSILCAVFKN